MNKCRNNILPSEDVDCLVLNVSVVVSVFAFDVDVVAVLVV